MNMSQEQQDYLEMLRNSDAKIESTEMIGDVLVIKLKPNIMCFVERNGASRVTSSKGAKHG